VFATPTIHSIVDAATYGRAEISAGSLATIFGSELAKSTAAATTFPLPEELVGTSVTIGGVEAPLLYVSPTQINFQVPWQVCCPGGGVTVTVSAGMKFSKAVAIYVSPHGPAIFFLDFQSEQGAVQIANTNVYAAPAESIPGAAARPALRGEILTAFCIGLGPVTNVPASGEPASSDSLSLVFDLVQVRIGGAIAPVLFAGLAPGFVGVYQVHFQVPINAPVGSAVPLSITVTYLPFSFPVGIAVE
jgi:uncharacterized protein (TIGR03437 family)